MNRDSVVSSVIASIGYDDYFETLEIEFISGRIYAYYQFEKSMAEDFVNAISKGRYYNRFVRGRFVSERLTA